MGGVKKEFRNGDLWISCRNCGKMFSAIPKNSSNFIRLILAEKIDELLCPDCCRIEAERIRQEERSQKWREIIEKNLEDCNIPEFYRIDRRTGKEFTTNPPVPAVCRWVFDHRNENILLSGATGAGKSTSVCFIGIGLIRAGKRLKYEKIRSLASKWREARTSDQPFADDEFFRKIGKFDYLIIDEMVDKNKDTDSSRAMMFELLDMVTSGEIKTKLWLVGNFRSGSIREAFGDEDPVRRRIQENFAIGGATRCGVQKFKVWEQK